MDISVLQWDSEFFKRSVAKISINANEDIDLAETLVNCTQQNYKLLYFFIDNKNEIVTKKIQKQLGLPINQKIIFDITDLSGENIQLQPNASLSYKLLQRGEADKIYNRIVALTIKAGTFSRFKLDEKIEQYYFEEMYRIWVKALLYNSNYRVIIIEDTNKPDDEIIGFIAYKIIEAGYKIDFMSISDNYKKQGLGKALIKKMTEQITAPNYVITEIHQQNIGAYNFFTNLGFAVKQTIDIYHVHF